MSTGIRKILVVGTDNEHMHRWLCNVSSELPNNITFDMFCWAQGTPAFAEVKNVFYGKKIPCSSILKRIPKLRGLINIIEFRIGLRHVLDQNQYAAMIVHQPATWQYPIVKLAKQKKIKIILTPWGSDVLRIPHSFDNKMSKMFESADYVTSNIPSFAEKYISRYNVDKKKMIYAGFGSEIFDLVDDLQGRYSKHELAECLGIPDAKYYIACGYNASRAQNHLLMIEAIGKNKNLLPSGSILLFQFTYGKSKNDAYINEIKRACEKYDLHYYFLTNYLSNEEVAKYRMLADLFIHIQPTDAANASLQEYLLAGCECINGGWLKYPHLEEFGAPYYICQEPEGLTSVVKDVLLKQGKRTQVTPELRTRILQGSWKTQRKYWNNFLSSI